MSLKENNTCVLSCDGHPTYVPQAVTDLVVGEASSRSVLCMLHGEHAFLGRWGDQYGVEGIASMRQAG